MRTRTALPKKVNLLYVGGPRVGNGVYTFTVHLWKGLNALGVHVQIKVLSKRTQHKLTDFGYGLYMQRVDKDEMMRLAKNEPCIVTSLNEAYRDYAASLPAHMVVHDPLELYHEQYPIDSFIKPPIVIRKTNKDLVDNAIFIPHPFASCNAKPAARRKKTGISLTRITRIKNIPMILDANRLLPKNRQIVIRGSEDRLYGWRALQARYPEWTLGGKAFPTEWGAAQNLYRNYTFGIDLTVISKPGDRTKTPLDGGGTQYSFLEAIDAGAVPVVHRSWLQFPRSEMKEGDNCCAVESAEELAELIRHPLSLDYMLASGQQLLARHDAKKIARRYLKCLNSTH